MAGWTYILRRADDSYYIGSTSYDDVEQRVGEHNDGKFGGYTSARRPVILVWAEQFGDLRDAQEWERRIKKWRREKKEALIRRDWDALRELSKRVKRAPPFETRAAARSSG